jgi:tetraacyldisaccharide 4'-kinase
MGLELFFQHVIKGKRRGFLSSLIKLPLKLLSHLYGFGVYCRNWAYDHGWFKQYSPPLPLVVSIGNITAGGTGKTPLTIMFAKALDEEIKVAIASRGYRSQAEHQKSPIIVSSGSGPMQTAAVCGDEPYLLAENLPHVYVFAGKNRIQSSNLAAIDGVQLLILEDGMQHRQLARDLDIVILDGRDPFGMGYFLPYGYLRDDPRSLSRAHLIVVNHVIDTLHFNEVKTLIEQYTTAPVVGVNTAVEGVFDLSGVKIEGIEHQRAGIFCGIANPEQFLQTVQGLGVDVVAEKYYPDHKLGSLEDLNRFARKCQKQGASVLLCTEKDKVKLGAESEIALPIGWVKMKLEVVAGSQEWNNFIAKIKKKLDTRSIR